MESKYFLLTLSVIINMLIFTSCLNSDGIELEYSADAQIYSLKLSSREDTSKILNSTFFTIDQVNGKIFNKEPLPFQFHVDSAAIDISGANSYTTLYDITLSISGSDDVNWYKSDSVDINKLYKITTIAPDGKTTKKYDFILRVHDKDPNIISWEKISNDYISKTITEQKTVLYNNRFITYFTSNETVSAVSSATNAINWSSLSITGLPSNILLSTLKVGKNGLYIIDEANNVFSSNDGFNWYQTNSDYQVIANYGIVPSDSNGKSLVIINDNNSYKFAKTEDFTTFQQMENATKTSIDDFPVRDFTSLSVNSPSSYTTKYIIVAGGFKKDNTPNYDIWIIQEKDGKISVLKSKNLDLGLTSISESSLYFYDNSIYLFTTLLGKNRLFYSNNFGLEWKLKDENQSLPTQMEIRKKASIITDENNYIWIFGGVSETQTQIDDVWRGRLNKFAQD